MMDIIVLRRGIMLRNIGPERISKLHPILVNRANKQYYYNNNFISNKNACFNSFMFYSLQLLLIIKTLDNIPL